MKLIKTKVPTDKWFQAVAHTFDLELDAKKETRLRLYKRELRTLHNAVYILDKMREVSGLDEDDTTDWSPYKIVEILEAHGTDGIILETHGTGSIILGTHGTGSVVDYF